MKKLFKTTVFLSLFSLFISCSNSDSVANKHYPVNKSPLKQTAFVKLPLGAVKPAGWLKDQLIAQSKGLTGHLDEFWPDLINSAWKGGNGEAWERGPYYLDGLIPLAYLLEDERLIHKAEIWVKWIIQSSKKNGWFGPDKNTDRWPLAVGSKDLMQYYEATGDAQALEVLKKYFNYLAHSEPDWPDSTWRGVRAMENAVTGYWLYKRTGDADILKAIRSIQENSYDWAKYYYEFPWDANAAAENRIPHQWDAIGLTAHVVNNAMAIKYPGLWYQQSKDEYFKNAVYEGLMKYDREHGQIGGRFSGDEHLSGTSPARGTELCSVVEFMFSLEQLIEVLGDPALADRLESLAYNALPATITPDNWAHQYNQQSNQVLVTHDKRPWSSNGEDANIYGLMPNYPCCLANMHQGWPKFVQSMWMATQDNGLALIAYGPSIVKAKVGQNGEVTITEETEYPFDGKIKLSVKLTKPTTFPLYLRIPVWAENTKLFVGGNSVAATTGQMVKIERQWHNGDAVEMELPFVVRKETRFNQSASILRGPLYYALRIGKSYRKFTINTKETQSIPYKGSMDWEILPTTDWNYGLILDENNLEKAATIKRNPISQFPFADIDEMIYDDIKDVYKKWSFEAPVVIEIQGKKIADWKLKNNSADVPPQSPVPSNGKTETLYLVPYGSTRLRIAEFPLIK